MSKKKEVVFKREFFDRDYTAREAYRRIWRYARRYKFRLAIGVMCGMLTAGTLLPLYQVIQPALAKVETRAPAAQVETAAPPAAETAAAEPQSKESRKLEKEYSKAQKLAAKFGIELQDENDALGLPLLAIIIFVVPLIAITRCALVFLNHYCLAWAGMRTVRDIRCDILKHVQEQGMQFHGRIDVGQLMSRATSDPQQVQQIIQHVLQELAQAPFEIIVSVGFIIYSAIANDMLVTLALIFIGFPMFMCPVVFLSKRIRKWSRRALERFRPTAYVVIETPDVMLYQSAVEDAMKSFPLERPNISAPSANARQPGGALDQ